MNPFLSTNTASNPYTPKPVTGPNPFLNAPTGPNPYLPTPTVQQPATVTLPTQPLIPTANAQTLPTPTVSAPKSLYTNGITSDPTEMANNKAKLAASIANLTPQQTVGFGLSSTNPSYDSSLLNTGTTRNDVYNALATKQGNLALGTDQNLQPTTGYQKFISDYSNAVKMTPEQIQAKTEVDRTTNEINNIRRDLENRKLQLTQQGGLSPAQVEADMKQYTTEANSRIADLLQANQQNTITYNALEAARKNTLDAYQVQAPFYKPTEISPGSQIIDPSTGKVITQGTGLTPQSIASQAEAFINQDQITGQLITDSTGAIDQNYYQNKAREYISRSYGANSNFSAGSTSTPLTGVPGSIPPAIQPYVIQSTDGTPPYINADRVPANALNYVRTQAAMNGIPVLTAGDVNGLQSVLYTQENIGKLEKVMNEVLSPGIIGRGVNIIKNNINSIFQNDPRLVAFNQARDTAIKSIQSLVAGSGSGFRLTQPEIDTATSNMPTANDNLETAKAKVSWVNNFLETKKNLLLTGTIGKANTQSSSLIQTKSGAVNTNW